MAIYQHAVLASVLAHILKTQCQRQRRAVTLILTSRNSPCRHASKMESYNNLKPECTFYSYILCNAEAVRVYARAESKMGR